MQRDADQQSVGQCGDRLAPDLGGPWLAGLRPPYHLGRVVAIGSGNSGRRRVHLEAAAPAAAARQRLGSGPHGDVADLAAGTVRAGIDPAVEGEAAGDPGADGQEQHPSGGPARAEP
jgi:hypothetical protein